MKMEELKHLREYLISLEPKNINQHKRWLEFLDKKILKKEIKIDNDFHNWKFKLKRKTN